MTMTGVSATSHRAEEIPFADIHAVMSQDVIGSGHVEENVRNRPALQKRQPLELQRALTSGYLDIPILTALERASRNALDKIQRARNARAQLIESLLIVLEARRFLADQPGQ